MPYDERMVAPMREELTRLGFRELRSVKDVDEAVTGLKGHVLVFVNSVCGCAAGMARPGMALAMEHSVRPDHFLTVFAGQDLDATARFRALVSDVPPSSPSIAMFHNGKPVWFLPRHQIEGRSAMDVANSLVAAFEKHCRTADVEQG